MTRRGAWAAARGLWRDLRGAPHTPLAAGRYLTLLPLALALSVAGFLLLLQGFGSDGAGGTELRLASLILGLALVVPFAPAVPVLVARRELAYGVPVAWTILWVVACFAALTAFAALWVAPGRVPPADLAAAALLVLWSAWALALLGLAEAPAPDRAARWHRDLARLRAGLAWPATLLGSAWAARVADEGAMVVLALVMLRWATRGAPSEPGAPAGTAGLSGLVGGLVVTWAVYLATDRVDQALAAAALGALWLRATRARRPRSPVV